jgi:hypothetical protein
MSKASLLLAFSFLFSGPAFSRPQQGYQYHAPLPAGYGVPTTTAPGRPEYNPEPANIQPIEFNYRYMLEHPQKDRLTLKLDIADPKVLAQAGKAFARVRYFDLSDDSKLKEAVVPVKFIEGRAYLDVEGLKPESVYKMEVDLFLPDPNDSTSSTLLARAGTFWGVTSGDSEVAQARHKIASTMILEENDWKLGRRHLGNAPYVYLPGNWCGIFPYEISKPYLKVWDEEPSDSYKAAGSFYSGFQVPAAGEAVHGNYGLRAAHKFTVLGYSPASKTVYTVEGNFGGGLGMNTRSASDFTGYGKINEKMIWPGPKATAYGAPRLENP